MEFIIVNLKFIIVFRAARATRCRATRQGGRGANSRPDEETNPGEGGGSALPASGQLLG